MNKENTIQWEETEPEKGVDFFLGWEAIITSIQNKTKEINPIVLEALAHGLAAKSIQDINSCKCDYVSCKEFASIIIDGVNVCNFHSKALLSNWINKDRTR